MSPVAKRRLVRELDVLDRPAGGARGAGPTVEQGLITDAARAALAQGNRQPVAGSTRGSRETLAPFVLSFVAGWLVSNVGAVASPMADAYSVSLAFVGALIAAAAATHAVMQIPSGRLVDRYGARSVAIGGLSILVAADGVGALAAEPALAVVARLAVGVGTALCFVSGSDLLRTRRARVLGQGVYGGCAMAAAGLALALLPQVARDTAWRVSWLSAAVLAAFGVAALSLLRPAAAFAPTPAPGGRAVGGTGAHR